jgi:hypothetical protein
MGGKMSKVQWRVATCNERRVNDERFQRLDWIYCAGKKNRLCEMRVLILDAAYSIISRVEI